MQAQVVAFDVGQSLGDLYLMEEISDGSLLGLPSPGGTSMKFLEGRPWRGSGELASRLVASSSLHLCWQGFDDSHGDPGSP